MTANEVPSDTSGQDQRSGAATVTAPADWVPADQRVAGFDRRTIWPGVALLIVWALWAHVIPWVNDQIALDNPVVAGDVINLGNREVTFEPAVGWDLQSGTLLESDIEASIPTSALLLGNGVSYRASTGNWPGTPEGLLDKMIDVNEDLDSLLAKNEQGRSAIENAEGQPGQIAYIVGVDEAALIATFVFEPDGSTTKIGVEIEVRGDPANLQDQVEEIASMINTTTYKPSGQKAN